MNVEVADILTALQNGAMSLDEVAQKFRDRSWPRRGPAPANYLELATAAQQDPEPYTPGSFDDVDLAYSKGELTDDQYEVLAQAMAESMREEDRRNAGKS